MLYCPVFGLFRHDDETPRFVFFLRALRLERGEVKVDREHCEEGEGEEGTICIIKAYQLCMGGEQLYR